MRGLLGTFRRYPALRWLFVARLQSELGSGAAWVALVLVAHERFRSPWAISLVLVGEFLPGVLLGPALGALADRYGRRRVAVIADIVSAASFIAMALTGSFTVTVALTLVNGAATCAFWPALMAALPTLVKAEDRASAMSTNLVAKNIGQTAGPAVCAVLLLVVGAPSVLALDGASFALQAVLVSRLAFIEPRRPALLAGTAWAKVRELFVTEVAEGWRATAGRPQVRMVIFFSAAVIVFGAFANVGEPLLAVVTLHGSGALFAAMAAVNGFGVVVGAMYCSADRPLARILGRFLGGMFLLALMFGAYGVAPNPAAALAAFGVMGVANALIVQNQQTFLVKTVPSSALSRVFGVYQAGSNLAFLIALVSAGALFGALGIRGAFFLAGGGALLVGIAATAALRTAGRRTPVAELAPAPEADSPSQPLLVTEAALDTDAAVL